MKREDTTSLLLFNKYLVKNNLRTMFTRHLKKFNNTAEMEAAIRDGLVASPYVIFNADRNTANMVLPDGKEAADIEYEPWLSPYLVSNMYTADPSNGDYTDPSGNFQIGYAEDEREGWKYVDFLYFYLNSQYLEGWGSTAETIATDTAEGSNTPIVLITEKGPLDAVVEYQENTNGFSESRTLAHLAWDAINENREISGDAGAKTVTWTFGLNDGTETSFWGEDIEYSLNGLQSLEGHYMQTDNNKIPEYYILVAYQKEDESLMASKDNILRAPVDFESMYKVYKAGIFRAYDYSADEPVVPGEDPTLSFNYVDVTYSTVADFVPAIYGDTSYYDSAAFFIVEQSTIDDMFNEHPGWSPGDALWSLIENNMIYPVTDASAGDTVDLAETLNSSFDGNDVYVFALLEHFENAVRDYYQPNSTGDNYAYETVQWAEAEEPTTTYFTMNVNSHAFDPNDASTYDVNVEFSGYPGDLSWPYVTFGAYKVTEMTPYGDVTTMSNVLGHNYDYFPAGGHGWHTIEIAIDLQPGESAYYCVCAAPMNDMPSTEMMYVAYQQVLVTVPSDEPVPSFAADGSAYISSTYTVPAGTDMGGWVPDNDLIYPTIVYGTTDATATDFMLGYYTAEDFASQTFPNQYYTSEEDYFNQAMWAYASGAQGTYDAYMMQADGISAVGNGDTYVFIGKFVQRENDMVLNSGPVIEIGRYPDDSSQGGDSSTSSNDIIAMHGNPGPTPTTENPFVTFAVDASIDALSNWDHMEVGIYSLNHYENNGYSSINDYRQNGFIKTCTIALTDGTAHYSIQTADDLNCTRIPAGDGYTFTGYDDTICVVAWFEIGYGAQQVAESNEIFELYEYVLPSGL